MNSFSHYFNLKQRIYLDITKLKNYKVIFFIILLILLYVFDSMFFNIFLYTSIYIYFFDYILLIADILFLDILFKKIKMFQKVYFYLRKHFYLIFYKYLVIDLLKLLKKNFKHYIKVFKGYLSRGWAEYNFKTFFMFIYQITKKLYYKLYYGFKRLRRRDKNSIFWKYIYIFYYREKNIKVLFLIICSYIYDIFCLIRKLHIFIIFDFIYNLILFLVYNIKYLCSLILGDIKYYYFKLYYKIHYIYFIIYYRIKFIMYYKYNFIKYNVLYYYYYIFCNIIKVIIVNFLISKIIFLTLFVINKYIYDYKNDYSIVITKIKYLKEYFFLKYFKMFNGFFFLKRDIILLRMLYKLLHVKTIYNILISFFKKIKKWMPIYNYIYNNIYIIIYNYIYR